MKLRPESYDELWLHEEIVSTSGQLYLHHCTDHEVVSDGGAQEDALWDGVWMCIMGGCVDVHYGRVCGCALWEGVWMCIMGRCVDVHYGRVCGCALWEGVWMCIMGRCVDVHYGKVCECVKV